MKKIIFILFLICAQCTFSQKKKTTNSKAVLAKLDNVSAEIITTKKQKKLVLFVSNATGKDTLEVKIIEAIGFKPLNFSIQSFTASDVKLYHIHWEEKYKIETKLRNEEQDITESQIWNIEKKELLIGNSQKSSHIVETVYLDKNKTASETQERNRKEGFEFILLPNGDFTLKNKTQQNDYSYNVSSMKYEIKKGSASKPTSTRKKR